MSGSVRSAIGGDKCKKRQYIPVVSGNGSPIGHVAPSLRRTRGTPDLLAPDDVQDIHRGGIILDVIADSKAIGGTGSISDLGGNICVSIIHCIAA